jgi:hypothetical protein
MGGLMEGKKWTHWVEIARLAVFVPIYNLCYYQLFEDWFAWVLPISLIGATAFGVWVLMDLLRMVGNSQKV